MTQRKKIAFLVPAHNEEDVIYDCLKSLSQIADPSDIYVVNDGSSDNTEYIAKSVTPNVLTLKRGGKATALNTAIERYNFIQNYEFIMPFDADTKIAPDFLAEIEKIYDSDISGSIAAVAGRVVGSNHNWVTTYRSWEYEVTQTIHKQAQSEIGTILVCPGCTTVFRTEVFQKVSYPTGTLTEDMDLTFLMHRKNIGRIVFASESKVYTQDPANFFQYIKQIERWYTGFWECVVKNSIPWGGQKLDLEVALLASEGLFNGLLVLVFFMFAPVLLIRNPSHLLVPIALDVFLFIIPSFVLAYSKTKSIKYLIYFPQIYFLRLVSALVFLKAFLKICLGIDLRANKLWNMKRYSTNLSVTDKLDINTSASNLPS